MTKTTKLTANEATMMNFLQNDEECRENREMFDGEMFMETRRFAKVLGWDVKTVKGVVGSLCKKGLIRVYDAFADVNVVSFR